MSFKMKLELKHLAPYLPYGLKVKHKYGWSTMTTLNEHEVNGDHEDCYSYEDHPDEDVEFKPMLKPLSDLTNDELEAAEYIIDKGENADMCWSEWTYLFEKHYDIFGLIYEGLAINVNAIK